MNFIELKESEYYDICGGTNWLKVVGGGLIVVGSIVALPEEITIAAGVTCAIGVASGIGCIIDGI